MFHVDVTLEDTRLIAVEHRVPLVGDELERAKRYNQMIDSGEMDGDHFSLHKHDGTFDVTLCDVFKGRTGTVNLTSEELAEGLRATIPRAPMHTRASSRSRKSSASSPGS